MVELLLHILPVLESSRLIVGGCLLQRDVQLKRRIELLLGGRLQLRQDLRILHGNLRTLDVVVGDEA